MLDPLWIHFDSGENNEKFCHIVDKLWKPQQDVGWDDELDAKWANALSLIVFIVIKVIEQDPGGLTGPHCLNAWRIWVNLQFKGRF